jgi:hypothetical protein
MKNETRGFVKGFVIATLIGGAGVVFALGEIYTPSTTWIQDPSKYAPGSNDQINVLADLQPGESDVMLRVGLRLNSLNTAGKKRNWGLAETELEQIEAAFDNLILTRPALATDLESFLTTSLEPVRAAATAPAPDKAAFKTALNNMAAACTSCHVTYGEEFLVVKLGKSALPLE